MTDTYVKLFGSITASTIWQEPAATRLVWITMLAMSDKSGCVYASVPGLAHIANVSLQETELALQTLLSPDKYSRTPDKEGRRIEPIDGGWKLLNHAKFRSMRSAEERREYMREYMREKREREKLLANPLAKLAESTDVTPPAPTPAPEEQKITEAKASVVRKADHCPQAEIVALYHDILPSLARVRDWTASRQGYLRKRWAESEERQSLDWWRGYFEYVSKSDFLMGRKPGRGGEPFECDLEWLVRPKNFVKVIEGKYENRRAA